MILQSAPSVLQWMPVAALVVQILMIVGSAAGGYWRHDATFEADQRQLKDDLIKLKSIVELQTVSIQSLERALAVMKTIIDERTERRIRRALDEEDSGSHKREL